MLLSPSLSTERANYFEQEVAAVEEIVVPFSAGVRKTKIEPDHPAHEILNEAMEYHGSAGSAEAPPA